MNGRHRISGIVAMLFLFSANAAWALDTGGMAVRSDTLFSSHGMKTRTGCAEERADITLFDGPDGKRPPVDKVIDVLALVGKSFNQEFGADYFYKMAVRYDGRTWIETLAGNCRDSFQDNTVSHCYYKVNF